MKTMTKNKKLKLLSISYITSIFLVRNIFPPFTDAYIFTVTILAGIILFNNPNNAGSYFLPIEQPI